MRKREADEPRLFDLPLAPVDDDIADGESANAEDEDLGAEEPARPAARPRGAPARESAAGEELPLFPGDFESEVASPPDAPHAGTPDDLALQSRPQPEPEPPGYAPFDEDAAAERRPVARGAVPAPFAARLAAALADLGVHATAAGAGWLGAVLLGAHLGAAGLLALAVYLLAFSFLYSVVSLAFWGRTPGMTAAGIVSRGAGGGPLTFGQTGLRWLAGVLTAALCGLPLLLALTGRSLADRLSGSRTLQYR